MWCFSIPQNFSDICMDVAFPATPMQTKPHLWIYFLWIRLLRHNLSRNNHTINISQLMGLAIYIWRLTTSAFEPHWRIQGKVCVKGPKRSLRNLLFPWNFFFCTLFSRGTRNKQEHAISKKTNTIVLTNSQSIVFPKENLQCSAKFVTAVWNEEYVYLNSPLWNQLTSTLVCEPLHTQLSPMYREQHHPKLTNQFLWDVWEGGRVRLS